MKKAFFIWCLSLFLAGVSSVFAGGLPSYKTLCKALKDLPGWQAEKCEGMNISGSPMGEIVTAHRTYTNGNKQVEASIVCGLQAMEYWAPFDHIQIENNEGFAKVTNIRGYDVGIGYNKQDKTGGIVVKLTKRKEDVTSVFLLNFENMSWQEALNIAELFDWDEMANMLK